jgi:stage IV sporulation protein FB
MLPFRIPETRFDLKFRILGVDARIHPTFLLCGFLFAAGAGGILFMLVGTVVLFISILVHEMGHALCGKHYGDRVPSILLYGLGGLYFPGSIRLREGKQIWMCLCGPLAGFILGAVAAGALFALRHEWLPYSDLLYFIIWSAIWINLIWGLVNLLPIFPLDGGQILREIVSWKFPLKDDAFSYTFSLIAAVIMVAAAIAAHIMFNIGIVPALLFAVLAFQNYQLRKHSILTGGMAQEEEEPREAWQQDPDWWKKK